MANTASYRYDLGDTQAIYLSNQGKTTTVTFSSSSAGQQQQSAQSLATGQWTAPPKIYKLGGGFVATIFAQQTYYLSIQGNKMHVASGATGEGIEQQIEALKPLTMNPVETPPEAAMPAMEPMQPMTMTMGNMSMSMGEMRMGDMTLNAQSKTSTHSETESNTAEKKFCAQCGSAVKVGDRFCAQCGHKLS